MVQDHIECPVTCKLTLANGGQIPPEFGVTDLGSAPFFELMTTNKNLNGVTASLKYTCESVLSKAGPGETSSKTTHSFDVTFEDECYNTNVYPALGSSASVSLYSPAAIDLAAIAYSSFACGPVDTTVVLVTPDSPSTPIFSVNDSTGKVVFDPADYENRGSYTIVMRSCVYVPNDILNDSNDVTAVCEQSTPFTIDVVDPCLSTSVLSDIFSEVMSQPQLQTDSISLISEMPSSTWPWMSSVGAQIGRDYDVCGEIVYEVILLDEFDAPVPS